MKPITDKDAEADTVFWGSDQHRTWEESESDSEVSYDLDESDSSESDSEMDEDDSGDAGSDESEEEEDQDTKKPKRVFRGGYKDPRGAGAPKRKTTRPPVQRVIRKDTETPPSTVERRQTRDTTRAITQQVTDREFSKKPSLKEKSRFKPEKHVWTQDELMEEARLTEEWNTADYEAYIRYTELSERERMQFLQKRKPKEQVGSYKVVHRSYLVNNEPKSEILIFPPIEGVERPLNDVLLGIVDGQKDEGKYKRFRYRHPRTGEGFNTAAEFRAIQEDWDLEERRKAEAVLEGMQRGVF